MDPSSEDQAKEQAAEVRPEPAASGSAESQAAPPDTPGQAVVRMVQPLEVDQSNVGAALGEFMDARSPIVGAMAVAAYRDLERLRDAVMDRWEQAERDKEDLREALYEEKEKNAVLEERQRGRTRLRRVQQFALVVGGPVFGGGLAVGLAENTLLGPGGILLVVGLAVVSLGTPLFGRGD